MEKGLVSIITPMYKGERFVGDTIRSVIAQTYENWEMIIVDDCSPDNGAGIRVVESFQKDEPRITLIKQKVNKGSAGARNTGIKEAKGQFLCLLDSDDYWDDIFLEEQLSLIKEKNASMVYASYRRVHEVTKEEVLRPIIVHDRINYHKYLQTYEVGCLTVLYDVSKIGKQYLNEDMKSVRDDTSLWLKILKEVDYIYGNKKILASYRQVGTSATHSKTGLVKPHWYMLREIEQLSLLKSIYYFSYWALTGFYKYHTGKK